MSSSSSIHRAGTLLSRLQGTPSVEFDAGANITHHFGEMPCLHCVVSQYKMPGLVCIPALSGGSCATCNNTKQGCYRIPLQFSGVAQVILRFAMRLYRTIATLPKSTIGDDVMIDDTSERRIRQMIAGGRVLRETCVLFGKLVDSVGRPLPSADDERAFRHQSNVVQYSSLKIQALQAAWAQTPLPSPEEATNRIMAIMGCLPENMVPPSFDELHRLIGMMQNVSLLPIHQVSDADYAAWPASTALTIHSDLVLPIQSLCRDPRFLTARIEHKALPASSGARAGNPGAEYNDYNNVRIYRRLDEAQVVDDADRRALRELRQWYQGWDASERATSFDLISLMCPPGAAIYSN